MKKILGIILIISGSMPLILSVLCLFSYPNALTILKLSDNADVKQSVGLFAAALLPAAVFQIVWHTGCLNQSGKALFLARYAGILLLLTGLIIILLVNRPDLGFGDGAKGVSITLLSFMITDRK